MSGFAVLFDPDSPPQPLESDFQALLQLTSRYKQLDLQTSTRASGKGCLAAKLDSPASLHTGIIRDEQSGSWVLAAGTLVALEGDNQPHTILSRLLQSYLKTGIKSLAEYDGSFALIIYNGIEESLSVISDPIGLFSIFYCQKGNRLLISSSALAVAALSHSKPDTLSVEHFLNTGQSDTDRTLWYDVKRLLAGSVIYTAPQQIYQTEYWSPSFVESINQLSFNKALDTSVELLSHTFLRAFPQKTKTWVDLTGGFDSRLVAIEAAKAQIPFSVYCMGPSAHPDVVISRQLSEKMGWDFVNTQLPEEWGDDQAHWFNDALGRGDGMVSHLRLATTLRGFDQRNALIKTNLNGVGGENLRGFCWQVEGTKIGKTSKVNYEALIANLYYPGLPLNLMRFDRSKEVRNELIELYIHQVCSKYADLPNSVQLDRIEISRDAGHGGAYLSAIAGLSRSIAPLCFKELVNFDFSVNYLWKYPRHHSLLRAILEKENKLLANIETTTGGPAIPIRLTTLHRFGPLWKDVTNRAVEITSKKILGKEIKIWPPLHCPGYPLPAWRAAFFNFAYAQGMLTHDKMLSAGLYKREEFNQYVEQVALGQEYHGEFLDRVISIEMVMRETGTPLD